MYSTPNHGSVGKFWVQNVWSSGHGFYKLNSNSNTSIGANPHSTSTCFICAWQCIYWWVDHTLLAQDGLDNSVFKLYLGPLAYNVPAFNGSLPTFLLNPYSWTKVFHLNDLVYTLKWKWLSLSHRLIEIFPVSFW